MPATATEAAIQRIAPELNLPPRRYRPNPYFKRGELPRLALDIMREAGEPLATRTIAARALAAKGSRCRPAAPCGAPGKGCNRCSGPGRSAGSW